MKGNKRRLKIFVFSDVLIGEAITDLVTKMKADGTIPADTEFVASSTEVCRGSFALKLRSSEFPVVEEATAYTTVDMREAASARS